MVRAWLNEAGDGLKKVIKKLPEKRERYHMKKGALGHYILPEVFLTAYLNNLEASERKRVEDLLSNTEKKAEIFADIQETVNEHFIKKAQLRRKSESKLQLSKS